MYTMALALDAATYSLDSPLTEADILLKTLATPTLYRRVNGVTHFWPETIAS